MALEVILEVLSTRDCVSLKINDTTPLYPDTSGYNGSNPTKAEITSTIITLTSPSGSIYTYSDYLPTQGQITLELADFTLSEETAEVESAIENNDCGCCDDCADTGSFSIEGAFEDKCWDIEYQVYIDEELISTFLETQFFSCVTGVRIVTDIKASACSDCEKKRQEAIWEARQDYEDANIVYARTNNCTCAGNLLNKANEILTDVENDNL